MSDNLPSETISEAHVSRQGVTMYLVQSFLRERDIDTAHLKQRWLFSGLCGFFLCILDILMELLGSIHRGDQGNK